MCGACAGGRRLSSAAAYLNLAGIKVQVARLLQEVTGPRAAVSAFGDRWVVRRPTGRQVVVDDVEQLAVILMSWRLVVPDRLAALEHRAALRTRRGSAIADEASQGPLTPEQFTAELLQDAHRSPMP